MLVQEVQEAKEAAWEAEKQQLLQRCQQLEAQLAASQQQRSQASPATTLPECMPQHACRGRLVSMPGTQQVQIVRAA